MKRKVIALAGKTLVVSLPSKWARSQNIVKGADVEVVEEQAVLKILAPAAKPQKKVISLDVMPYSAQISKSPPIQVQSKATVYS